MAHDTLSFLKRLLDTPGPSGFELAPARVWRDEVKSFADQVSADVHGNSVAVVNPQGAPRLMLAGHIDEIGLQITHVDDDGYLYFAGIGGWDPQVLVGQRVVITGPTGPVRGVIGKQAVHLMKREDLDKVSKITDLWIDIGARTRPKPWSACGWATPRCSTPQWSSSPTAGSCRAALTTESAPTWWRRRCGCSRGSGRGTPPCSRWRPPARRSPGRGAAREPAPWGSIRRWRWWWT